MPTTYKNNAQNSLKSKNRARWVSGLSYGQSRTPARTVFIRDVAHNIQMIQNLNKIIIAILAGLIIQSCDPYYPVSITNSTEDTLTVIARTTTSFQSNDIIILESSGPYDDERIKFKITPGETVECGGAVAGLEDDVPFTELIIYSQQDSIKALNKEEVLNLFEKNSAGQLKTPYELVVD